MSGLIARRLAAVSIVSAGPFVGALEGATVGGDDGVAVDGGADDGGADDGAGDALLEDVGCALGLPYGALEGEADVVGEPDGCEVGSALALGTLVGTEVGTGLMGPGEPPPPEHALTSAHASTASPVVDRRESKDHPRATQTSLRY